MRIRFLRSDALLAASVGVALAGLFLFVSPGIPDPAQQGLSAAGIDALPPSGAGVPSGQGETMATGRVAGVYLETGQGVFLALDQTPAHLRTTAARWVDVEFPDLLANGSGAARAMIDASQPSIGVGDLVGIKFGQTPNANDARPFPVAQPTRVTGLVAKRDEKLAADYERRILARTATAPRRN